MAFPSICWKTYIWTQTRCFFGKSIIIGSLMDIYLSRGLREHCALMRVLAGPCDRTQDSFLRCFKPKNLIMNFVMCYKDQSVQNSLPCPVYTLWYYMIWTTANWSKRQLFIRHILKVLRIKVSADISIGVPKLYSSFCRTYMHLWMHVHCNFNNQLTKW